jgi:phytoene dehydrogenase-like protein
MPAMPPVVCHVGVSRPVEGLAHEVVLHGEPTLVVRSGGRAPEGGAAYTVHGRGKLAEDVLVALARHRIDQRKSLVTRVDRSPRDQAELWRSSPYGVLWAGRGTVRQRLGPRTPIAGVYAVGASATPGAGVPYVGLSAALVAQVIGPA